MTDWRVAPVFIVRNLAASIPYYRDRLKFQVIGTFGTPLEMAFVGRHGVQLMLQDAEGKATPGANSKYKSVAWDALFWVDDVRALHDEMAGAGADIHKAPYLTFYGRLEFEVRDPDGHVLCFSEPADRNGLQQEPGHAPQPSR